MSLRLLAVVDSESFLKWAATTLDQIAADGTEIDSRVVIIRGPLEPSASQTAAAVSGTTVSSCPVVSRRRLAALVREYRPDAVVVAATGPVAEMIALTVLKASAPYRPPLISGPPGMAMASTSTTGVKWRARWCDAFIVHSPREVALFADAFAAHGAHPRTVVARLPFLGRPLPDADAPVTRVVFAPQPILPHGRAERVAILEGLAGLREQGFEVVVKLRARAGEQQTHHEALPFDRLWLQEHRRLGYDVDALRFETGAMSEWLRPGTALVTVSSTAALESLSLGLPTALIADFGIAPGLVNEIYAGSGCMRLLSELAETFRNGGPVPNEEWLATTYLHELPSELGAVVGELVHARRTTVGATGAMPAPLSRAIASYSALKSDVPALWYPAKWARDVIGRFVQLT